MWDQFMQSFLKNHMGNFGPWVQSMEGTGRNDNSAIPDWLSQMMGPMSNGFGNEGGSPAGNPFANLEQLKSQWPFSSLGFDPFESIRSMTNTAPWMGMMNPNQSSQGHQNQRPDPTGQTDSRTTYRRPGHYKSTYRGSSTRRRRRG